MSSRIVQLKAPPSGLAKRLRELAVLADEGKLVSACVVYILDDYYGFTYAASLNDCLVMATLLQQNCVDRMRR